MPTADQAGAERGYPGSLRALHWLTAVLLAGPYAAVWAIGHASDAGAEVLAMLHRSFGLSVLVVTAVRLCWRLRSRIPPLPADMPAAQRLMARASVVALYGLLMLQPLLGLTGTMLSGDRATVFGGIVLPALSKNGPLSDRIFQVHGWVAIALLTMVGLHVSAALYHHFVRRDEVLAGMLPGVRANRNPALAVPARSPR